MSKSCGDPRFEYDPETGLWSYCEICGRGAWSHLQANPVQDILNLKQIIIDRLSTAAFPPTMDPVAPTTKTDEDETT